MAANFTASATFRAIDKMSAPMRRMQKASQTFSKKAQVAFAGIERRMRRLKRAIGNLGLVMGGALIITAFTSLIGVFADFEQANASLASVMSTATEPQLVAMQTDAKRLGATTAKTATEVIGLQEAFARLGFESTAIINMTESTINGSVAMKGPLSDTAELVGAMVKSFDAFESVNAPTIIDQMTLATQKSALNFEKLQTGLPIVSGAANAAGISFTRLMALMGKLSDAGIDASSSSTALRNIFLDSAKQGHSYVQILASIEKNQSKLTAANDEFGKRGAVSAVILAKQLDKVSELDKVLQGATNTAMVAANKQLDTLNGRLTIMGSAWQGLILSVEDGNGTFGRFLKTSIEVATEILNIASGAAKARGELTEAQLRVRKFAEKAIFFIKVLKWTALAFVALKVAILANQAVLIAANFIRFAIIFTKIARANGIWTAAQWALNFALSANPIGLIIIGVAALIALIVTVIKKWDTWGAAVSIFLGPLGAVIGLIQSFRRNWDLVKESFSSGGILKGLLSIGKVILDAILMPVQQLLQLLGKIPGLNFANTGAASIAGFRENLLAQERALLPADQQSINTTATTTAQENISREERITTNRNTLDINNNTGFPAFLGGPSASNINLSTTN